MSRYQQFKEFSARTNVRTDTERRISLYNLLLPGLSAEMNITDVVKAQLSVLKQHPGLVKDEYKLAFTAILNGMGRGLSLARSLEGWVPDDELTVIDAYSESGLTKEGIQKALDRAAVSQRISKAVTKPLMPLLVMFLALVGVTMMLSLFLTPIVDGFQPVANWPKASLPYYHFSQFIESFGGWVLGFFVFVVIAAFAALPHWTGAVREVFDSLPPFNVYKRQTSASFISSISILFERNIGLKDSLPMTRRNCSKYMQNHIDRMLLTYRRVGEDGDALTSTGLFSGVETLQILTFARSGDFATNMQLLAASTTENVEDAVGKLMASINVVSTAVIVIMFLWGIGSLGWAIADFALDLL